jgi:hypothetical protein
MTIIPMVTFEDFSMYIFLELMKKLPLKKKNQGKIQHKKKMKTNKDLGCMFLDFEYFL